MAKCRVKGCDKNALAGKVYCSTHIHGGDGSYMRCEGNHASDISIQPDFLWRIVQILDGWL